MDRKGLTAAQEALERCRKLHADMAQAQNAKQMSDLWGDFLINSQRFFSRIDGASTGKSTQWGNDIKKARKDDELLEYIHQARHADEHGLEKIADATDASLGINAADPRRPFVINHLSMRGGQIVQADLENARFDFNPANAKLLPVKNRGTVYQPPRSHLGKPWANNDARSVAGAALSYMDRTASEAATFVQ